jgi:lipopolysaccharide transport system permease protein
MSNPLNLVEPDNCPPELGPPARPRDETRNAPSLDRVTVIRPVSSWQLINFRELWQFRDLLYFLMWRDVKVRYKQTLLGAAWAILQPVLLMVVFLICFSRVPGVSAGDYQYYPLFVYAGLLPWTFFATAINNSGNSIVGSERLITKVYFPRLAVTFAAVGAAAVDFCIAFGLLAAMMVYYWQPPTLNLLLVPVIFGIIVLAAAGVGTGLAALNVAYRDVRYVIPFLVQVWMFATPTIYMQPPESPQGSLLLLLRVNPMAALVAAFRAAVLGGTIPWAELGLSSACALLFFLTGCLYFRKVENNFADII